MLVATVRYNSNTKVPRPAGDLATVVYDVTVAAGPNAYPLGGEPVSFAAEFREVQSVVASPLIDNAAAGMATAGALAAVFQRAAGAPGVNTGVVRIFVTGAALQANLAELAAGVYATALIGTLTVVGRPFTDAS